MARAFRRSCPCLTAVKRGSITLRFGHPPGAAAKQYLLVDELLSLTQAARRIIRRMIQRTVWRQAIISKKRSLSFSCSRGKYVRRKNFIQLSLFVLCFGLGFGSWLTAAAE